MERSSSSTSLCQSLSPLLNQLCEEPRVAWLMNTRPGQYLRQHPVFGLTAFLFTSMAALPVGLFVVFALVTLVMSAVGFVFIEVILLFVAGLTLLFTLSGLAFFSVVASFIFGTFYIMITSFYKGYTQHGATKSPPTAAEEERVDPQN
ncbi:lipid droplet assembly factor 1-like [Eucyclogobius newberryi]|uniref:lipid droplet assembly factor 1-like n=1 Tax=Eucyclogobius newberryi TaxID=166745 RepID=UPI003B5CB2D5